MHSSWYVSAKQISQRDLIWALVHSSLNLLILPNYNFKSVLTHKSDHSLPIWAIIIKSKWCGICKTIRKIRKHLPFRAVQACTHFTKTESNSKRAKIIHSVFTLLAQDFNPWKRFALIWTLQPGSSKQIPPFKEKNAVCRLEFAKQFAKWENICRSGMHVFC